tara:strand:+ start:960 stop:2981 length:2022 start_codon:yes stop_codon:yes gene_type:complete
MNNIENLQKKKSSFEEYNTYCTELQAAYKKKHEEVETWTINISNIRESIERLFEKYKLNSKETYDNLLNLIKDNEYIFNETLTKDKKERLKKLLNDQKLMKKENIKSVREVYGRIGVLTNNIDNNIYNNGSGNGHSKKKSPLFGGSAAVAAGVGGDSNNYMEKINIEEELTKYNEGFSKRQDDRKRSTREGKRFIDYIDYCDKLQYQYYVKHNEVIDLVIYMREIRDALLDTELEKNSKEYIQKLKFIYEIIGISPDTTNLRADLESKIREQNKWMLKTVREKNWIIEQLENASKGLEIVQYPGQNYGNLGSQAFSKFGYNTNMFAAAAEQQEAAAAAPTAAAGVSAASTRSRAGDGTSSRTSSGSSSRTSSGSSSRTSRGSSSRTSRGSSSRTNRRNSSGNARQLYKQHLYNNYNQQIENQQIENERRRELENEKKNEENEKEYQRIENENEYQRIENQRIENQLENQLEKQLENQLENQQIENPQRKAQSEYYLNKQLKIQNMVNKKNKKKKKGWQRTGIRGGAKQTRKLGILKKCCNKGSKKNQFLGTIKPDKGQKITFKANQNNKDSLKSLIGKKVSYTLQNGFAANIEEFVEPIPSSSSSSENNFPSLTAQKLKKTIKRSGPSNIKATYYNPQNKKTKGGPRMLPAKGGARKKNKKNKKNKKTRKRRL